MRAWVLCAAVFIAGTARTEAEGPSTACSDEIVRHLNNETLEVRDRIEPSHFWVNAGAETLGPMTAIEIKRAMLKGELPTGLWVHFAGEPANAPGWTWSAALADLRPLPGSPDLKPDDLGTGLQRLLADCWVSDPLTSNNRTFSIIILLLPGGDWYFHFVVRTAPTNIEEYFLTADGENRWSVASNGGAEFSLHLPSVEILQPRKDFTGRVIDRNAIELHPFSDLPPVVLRRM